MTEPRTEAGRELFALYYDDPDADPALSDAILAIEAEAAGAALAALRAQVEALPEEDCFVGHSVVARTAVLDLLSGLLTGVTKTDAPAAPAAPALDPADTRPELVVWFHESEEICEHDNPDPRDWPCSIMADHLMRAFDLEPRITVRPDGTASFEGRHFHRLTEYGVLLEVAAERAEYARLAAPAAPAAPLVDVERLAKAMRKCGYWYWNDPVEDHATKVAAVYARLANPEKP